MKKILIISPHFPPSNLTAVHRSRLFAQHLPSFGWEPIILTVHEKFYEEKLDHHLEKLLPADLRVEKVNAFRITKPRLIGDIGLRSFFQLYKKAKQIINQEKIDFLYISVPSFYTALLGRWLHSSTNIKYAIDYIDPWVHRFPGTEKVFSRHWITTHIAKILEPIAVKKASLITGMAEGYYKGVMERNPHLLKQALFGEMPFGGEEEDHKIVAKLGIAPYLFKKKEGKLLLLYAGAMLPKAYAPLERIFKVIQAEPQLFSNIEFHFIGTGKSPNDPESYNIKSLAEQYGLWQTTVFEYPQRIPYLDVLVHLHCADGIFILGSTEPHYTPSKIFQGVMSGKPILAVLHQQSSAGRVLETAKAGILLNFNGVEELDLIEQRFAKAFEGLLHLTTIYHPPETNAEKKLLEQYSAKSITGQLSELLNRIVK